MVTVSKFHPAQEIKQAYNSGQRIFGENRPQELAQKVNILPPDIKWHFIGNLQSNKLKYVIPSACLIHSVDSYRLLMDINNFANARGLKVNCLLEVFIAKEESKHGFSPEEVLNLLDDLSKNPLSGVEICGLMGMATFTEDQEQIRSEFKVLSILFMQAKDKYSTTFNNFVELSKGMSGDYHIALEYGSTLVRIGTQIFGPRQY